MTGLAPPSPGRGLLVGLVVVVVLVSAGVLAFALVAPHGIPAFLGPLAVLVPVCVAGFAMSVLRRR